MIFLAYVFTLADRRFSFFQAQQLPADEELVGDVQQPSSDSPVHYSAGGGAMDSDEQAQSERNASTNSFLTTPRTVQPNGSANRLRGASFQSCFRLVLFVQPASWSSRKSCSLTRPRNCRRRWRCVSRWHRGFARQPSSTGQCGGADGTIFPPNRSRRAHTRIQRLVQRTCPSRCLFGSPRLCWQKTEVEQLPDTSAQGVLQFLFL